MTLPLRLYAFASMARAAAKEVARAWFIRRVSSARVASSFENLKFPRCSFLASSYSRHQHRYPRPKAGARWLHVDRTDAHLVRWSVVQEDLLHAAHVWRAHGVGVSDD